MRPETRKGADDHVVIPNEERIAHLAFPAQRPWAFGPGALVRARGGGDGTCGRICAAYADLEAAIDAFIIRPGWYERLARRPKTQPEEQWFAIILPVGSILAGERDLELVPEGC